MLHARHSRCYRSLPSSLWAPLQLVDPGTAAMASRLASVVADHQQRENASPLQINSNETTLLTPPGHVRTRDRCSLIDHPNAIGSNDQNDGEEYVEEDDMRGEEEVEEE